MPTSPRFSPPRSVRPSVLTTLVVVVGSALAIVAYVYNVQLQRAHVEIEFVRRAETRAALTREVLNHYVSAVYSLKALFQGSDRVSRSEFSHVAREVLARYPGIAALEWIPIVPGSRRSAFEQEISAELGRSFQFTEPAADPLEPMLRARDRPEHFPIVYLEPLVGNERAFGFDVQGAPTRPFLERARQSRELVTTAQFQLVQSRRGIVIICPVFPVGSSVSTDCLGFVQAVFVVSEMLEQPQLRTPAYATDTLVVDDTATNAVDRLLHYSAAEGPATDGFPVSEEEFRKGLHHRSVIEFGGRRWVALSRPAAGWTGDQDAHYPELWLASGLCITVLIASLITVMGRRTAAVEKLVAERTAELEESRRHLDSLLHALPGMAFRARYDDAVTVLFASEGAFALTGRTAADFMEGRAHFRDVIHPDDLDRVRQVTCTALAERRDFEIEYRLRTIEGREKWVLARGRGVYRAEGPLEFFEGLAIDITARKQAEVEKLALERKLLETQKLESLGLLAGGIAHDFNNLLTGIMGNASLARHRADLDSEVTEHLRKIESGAGRAAELCQQMLAYSGRGRFLVESIDLGQLVRDTLPLLRGALSPRARLQLALSPDPTVISADATQIRQIVMNLILNAGDALEPGGGEIVVITGRQTLDREFFAAARVGENLKPGDYIVLEVRDTGCGMSPDTLAKIFDPFFTTKFTGRGLGLAAVLGIVRGHSGALRVRSEIGAGSTFTLALPPAAASSSPARSTASAAPWKRQGKVLVIDDEEPVREVAAQLLGTFGFTVETAGDGPSALVSFSRDPDAFDLVFLDLTMPGMDGEETLAALRAIRPGVRVLLVSGYSETEHIASLANDGPMAFLQKPFTRARLEKKIRELLG